MAQNLTTTLALLFWPIFALIIFATKPVCRATLWTILGAQLLLPEGAALKIPGVPQFDKVTIANIAALAGYLFYGKAKLELFPRFGVVEVLIVLFVISPFVTSELNSDIIARPDGAIPSLGAYDGLSALVGQCLLLIPFILGRCLAWRTKATEQVMFTLVGAGLFYSLPLLFEIRYSPQLHGWVYGYFPSEWYQEVRSGGFRPVVFMGHGLVASFFTMTTVVAAAAVWRAQPRLGALPSGPVTGYLATVLFMCQSFGATLYGLLLTPLVRSASPRFQIRLAMILALAGVAYPVLRTLDLVPTQSMISAVAIISVDRSVSLQTRFDQEQQLLARALERPIFGWGRWGRSRVYNDDLNKDVSITDGRWIITLGQYGILGFIAEFGLLAISVLSAGSAIRRLRSQREQIFITALALIVAINMIELLPNSTLLPWTFLVAGILAGTSEKAAVLAKKYRSTSRAAVKRTISAELAGTAVVPNTGFYRSDPA
jgi:hypothetical protein